MNKVIAILALLVVSVRATCTPSPTNICVTLDFFDGETGYYYLDTGNGPKGPSPTIQAYIGQTITFDQTDESNWYHPIGFAYEPDGAHGSDWGGAELAEVERADELQYKINSNNPTCADAGDTGLDCYEPEFFYPRSEWLTKEYKAELTITQEVANDSFGGVIYYFCHIHSKMSGKIEIYANDNLTNRVSGQGAEKTLYTTSQPDEFDSKCGTTAISPFKNGGVKACNVQFFPGTHDTDFEQCLQAIDCQMHWDMYGTTTANHASKIQTFMQQMIPHHQNAVNMAKLLLKQSTQAEIDAVEDLEDVLKSIINVQNFQVHYFRNNLNPDNKLLMSSDSKPSHFESSDCECESSSAPKFHVFRIMQTIMIAGFGGALLL